MSTFLHLSWSKKKLHGGAPTAIVLNLVVYLSIIIILYQSDALFFILSGCTKILPIRRSKELFFNFRVICLSAIKLLCYTKKLYYYLLLLQLKNIKSKYMQLKNYSFKLENFIFIYNLLFYINRFKFWHMGLI